MQNQCWCWNKCAQILNFTNMKYGNIYKHREEYVNFVPPLKILRPKGIKNSPYNQHIAYKKSCPLLLICHMSNAYVCSRAVKCSTMSAAFLQTILCRTNTYLDSLATAIAWNLLFVWMIKIFQISQNLFTSLVYPELLHSLAFSRLLRNLAREQIHSYANSPPKHQISELWMVNINENGLKNQFYLMVFWQNTMVLWIILCEQLVISMQMVTVITREKPRKYLFQTLWHESYFWSTFFAFTFLLRCYKSRTFFRRLLLKSTLSAHDIYRPTSELTYKKPHSPHFGDFSSIWSWNIHLSVRLFYSFKRLQFQWCPL